MIRHCALMPRRLPRSFWTLRKRSILWLNTVFPITSSLRREGTRHSRISWILTLRPLLALQATLIESWSKESRAWPTMRLTLGYRQSLGFSAASTAEMFMSNRTSSSWVPDFWIKRWFRRKQRRWCSRSSKWSSVWTQCIKWHRCSRTFSCRKRCMPISSRMLIIQYKALNLPLFKSWRMVTGRSTSRRLARSQYSSRWSPLSSRDSTLTNSIIASWCGWTSSALSSALPCLRRGRVTNWLQTYFKPQFCSFSMNKTAGPTRSWLRKLWSLKAGSTLLLSWCVSQGWSY